MNTPPATAGGQDPMCNERGVPESECPPHCHHRSMDEPRLCGTNFTCLEHDMPDAEVER